MLKDLKGHIRVEAIKALESGSCKKTADLAVDVAITNLIEVIDSLSEELSEDVAIIWRERTGELIPNSWKLVKKNH